MVHVEVHHRDTLASVGRTRMQGADDHIVDEAKAHGARGLRMMAGRPDGTKGITHIALHHRVDGPHDGRRRHVATLRQSRAK